MTDLKLIVSNALIWSVVNIKIKDPLSFFPKVCRITTVIFAKIYADFVIENKYVFFSDVESTKLNSIAIFELFFLIYIYRKLSNR